MFSLKRISFVGIALFMMVMLYGCGNSGQEAQGENSPPAVKSEPVATNSSETRTIKDVKGDVEIPVNPVRIADVSGSTEELLVLGYKPVITGNTDMANSMEITPILKKNCLM